ncbi:zinc finger domain-containing protein [Mycobacterium sp.]|uniref:zinc finger domain-containing protein n=1 Tax=Mycobacterium sp. TaxID=1785 RepID=UPI003F805CFC
MTDYQEAKAIVCPTCAAKPGNPCVNAHGSRMWLLHPTRWRAAAGRKASDCDRDDRLAHRGQPDEYAEVDT